MKTSDKDLLLLAGKLAQAADAVVRASAYTISQRIYELKEAMDNYDNAVASRLEEATQP